MRTADDCIRRWGELKERVDGLEKYLLLVTKRRDWHGVMDAAADLRDTEAEIEALRWVLE